MHSLSDLISTSLNDPHNNLLLKVFILFYTASCNVRTVRWKTLPEQVVVGDGHHMVEHLHQLIETYTSTEGQERYQYKSSERGIIDTLHYTTGLE